MTPTSVRTLRKPCLARLLLCAVGLALPAAASTSGGNSAGAIREIALSRSFFNPTFGQRVEISFRLSQPGRLTSRVLDRDGFVTRTLADDRMTPAGMVRLDWDGRSDRGEVVPDEAYSVQIDLRDGAGRHTYFPADEAPREVPVEKIFHDAAQKLLRYELAEPSRVHVQAGSSDIGPQGQTNGPVLKTIANRVPRTSGLILESWDGMDESGSFSVPGLKNFVLAVAATSLPENSIITLGNRSKSFLEHARDRQGKSFLTRPKPANHDHHQGLTALEDAAPGMRLLARNAAWSASRRSWEVRNDTLKVSVSLEGPSAPHFSRQPGAVFVFLDEKKTLELPVAPPPLEFSLSVAGLEPGQHRVSVNWISEYGPVTVNSLLIWVGPARPAREKSGR